MDSIHMCSGYSSSLEEDWGGFIEIEMNARLLPNSNSEDTLCSFIARPTSDTPVPPKSKTRPMPTRKLRRRPRQEEKYCSFFFFALSTARQLLGKIGSTATAKQLP
jgi:hypothetical protein